MLPTLAAGQGLIATPYGSVRAGQVRCVEHPQRPGFWLVKRVAAVHPDGTMTLSSDNQSVPTVDSRVFGPVAAAGSYRVLFAVPLRLM